jgi:hypothetical protein
VIGGFNQHGPGGYSDLEGLVYQIVGAASMCWTDVDKAGVFDDSEARDVADKALAEIRRYIHEE